MDKRYRKIGNTYVAIHYRENKVYLVEDTAGELEVKMWTGRKAVEQVNRHRGQEIDAATFVAKFSNAVAKLYSQTPYA